MLSRPWRAHKSLSLLLLLCFMPGVGADDRTAWSDRMHGMLQPVLDLLPYVYNQQKFMDPAQESVIRTRIANFLEAVHAIPPKAAQQVVGDDPLIPFTLARLKTDVGRAQRYYLAGSKEPARYLLQGSVNHCYNCHSREQVGQDLQLPASVFTNLELGPADRAELYVATRQYDPALELLSRELQRPINSFKDPQEPARLLRIYLAIVVRIKHDPQAALTTLDNLLKQSGIYPALEASIRDWRNSLLAWSKEKSSGQTSVKVAQRLIESARSDKSAITERHGDIEYLRASALLFDALKAKLTKHERAKIYSLLGQSHERLFGLWGVWDVAELYYEACIRDWPGAVLAKQCYRSFVENLRFGYTGSGGTSVPEEEEKRRRELARLAGY